MYTPKIDIHRLKKEGHLDENRFYELLGVQCNYMAPEAVKSFYMGLVRHISSELRKNGVARLPKLGDFALVKMKDKYGWKGKVMGMVTGTYMLKFYANQAWKTYFSKLAERDGREGSLDPREKLQNMDLGSME